MDDEEIILLLQRDPAAGLRELIRKYRALAAAIAGRVLSSRSDVEECVQDTFVKIWKNAPGLAAEGSLKGYVACAARNTAISRWRALSRRRERFMDPPEEGGNDPLEDLAFREDVSQLREAVCGLEEPDREIFLRHYFLFEKLADIAPHVGLTVEQLKKRLYRGRLRLRKALEERGVTR